MSLNIGSARSYNVGRNYSVHAIWVIQRHMGMPSHSGSFDNDTIRTIYDWQGSPDRMTSLKQDGKFGPNSLGCMLAEMLRGPISTDIAHLNRYPHNLPSGSGPGESAVVSSFLITNVTSLNLRTDSALGPNGWQLRGRFRVNVRLNSSLANPNRYQYRQFIKGYARSTPGRFNGRIPSETNWVSNGTSQDESAAFAVPGGLSSSAWREDGLVSAGGTRKFGYRTSAAFVAPGEEDRYLPSQQSGKEYVCVDTYGLMGSNQISGTKIELSLHYKGVIVDVLNSDREVTYKTWSYSAERIFT